MLTFAAVGKPIEGGARDRVGVERAEKVGRDNHHARLGIDLNVDLDLLAGLDPAACRFALLKPSRQRPRMIATRLRHVCPLMVILTGGRLPAPSDATTSGGSSSPLIGSGGSTTARNFTIASP
jgi:hypothetical protein